MGEKEEIVREILSFYNKLYKEGKSRFASFEVVEWPPISDSLANWLIKPFDADDILRAIFERDGNKSLGPDGYSMSFYQHKWETLKGDLLKVFEEFHRNGIINADTNETYICLI